jgi:hypothetical protein
VGGFGRHGMLRSARGNFHRGVGGWGIMILLSL